jgi:hypothetical protein
MARVILKEPDRGTQGEPAWDILDEPEGKTHSVYGLGHPE